MLSITRKSHSSNILLSNLLKVQNINLNFCLHINDCLLTKNTFSLINCSSSVLRFSTKVRDVVYGSPSIITDY